MIIDLLRHYYEKLPITEFIEDSYIESFELHYYLFKIDKDNESQYIAVVQNGYEYPNFITTTIELLKEHAGVTVTSWLVLNSAHSSIDKDTLNNDEAGSYLDKLLYEPDVDINSHSYAVANITLDFNPNVYGNKRG